MQFVLQIDQLLQSCFSLFLQFFWQLLAHLLCPFILSANLSIVSLWNCKLSFCFVQTFQDDLRFSGLGIFAFLIGSILLVHESYVSISSFWFSLSKMGNTSVCWSSWEFLEGLLSYLLRMRSRMASDILILKYMRNNDWVSVLWEK